MNILSSIIGSNITAISPNGLILHIGKIASVRLGTAKQASRHIITTEDIYKDNIFISDKVNKQLWLLYFFSQKFGTFITFFPFKLTYSIHNFIHLMYVKNCIIASLEENLLSSDLQDLYWKKILLFKKKIVVHKSCTVMFFFQNFEQTVEC